MAAAAADAAAPGGAGGAAEGGGAGDVLGRVMGLSGVADPEEASEWEDWDAQSNTSFLEHVLAGSAAGVAEHVFVYPLDTLKTHAQCQACPKGQAQTEALLRQRREMSLRGFVRLWRGVTTAFWGCIPAHAAYFSLYEAGKKAFSVDSAGIHPLGAAAAGAMATLAHDAIMTPIDVVKQRLQLGFYKGVGHCVRAIALTEGVRSFFVSLPTTVLMNVPYGAMMVATNETVKKLLHPDGRYTVSSIVVAGAVAGAVAAAITTPLDVVKTRLQTAPLFAHTHTLPPHNVVGGSVRSPLAHKVPEVVERLSPMQVVRSVFGMGSGSGTSSSSSSSSSSASSSGGKGSSTCIKPHCQQPIEWKSAFTKFPAQAVRDIFRESGWTGFFRGIGPRVALHAPSVAISWTAYESAKRWLASG